MTRIVGGVAGGRRLRTPPGGATRPTSDRVREALFSALEAALGTLRGHRLLDLYAGSGAVGLEALSRGASAATAVESDRRTAALVRANARDLGLPLEVVTASVTRALEERPGSPYDVVFADPPYPTGEEQVARMLALLVGRGWLVPGGLVVLERSSRSPEPTWAEGLVPERSKKYGETVLWYVRADPTEPLDRLEQPEKE